MKRQKKSLNITVTYHDPCHLIKGQKVLPENPRKIIKMIPGVKFVEMKEPDSCCGAGGGLRSGNMELSMKVGNPKVKMIDETKADVVTTICPFCQYQLRELLDAAGHSNINVLNIIELLNDAYD